MADIDLFSSSPNASRFFEILEDEFERAVRIGTEVTLIFIKLGRLADIGKSYGQFTAERILREINRLIDDNIRIADRGFIYGKDEFMIILRDTPKDGAQNMVPKLKRIIENCNCIKDSDIPISLAPLFGIASYPTDTTMTVCRSASSNSSRT